MARPRVRIAALLLAAAVLTGCGTRELDLPDEESAMVKRGGELFYENCSGCHTLDVAGAEGSAQDPSSRERTDGPNFNQRPVSRDAVLYAIRNGGFSGAIMPENIVVGDEAEAVAAFLAKYSGRQAESPVTPNQGDTPENPTGELSP